MEKLQLSLTQFLDQRLKAVMKKVRLGMASSALYPQALRNAELTLVVTSYVLFPKFTVFSVSKQMKLILCFGSTL
jgi:hypothetical protein